MTKRPFKNTSRRAIANRLVRRRFKIFTDGTETEKNYFEDLNKITSNVIDVTSKNVDIDKLVDLAIKYQQSEQYDADYDEVCIVCDIDERLKTRKSKTSLLEALSIAKKNNIKTYLSNESFDVWLLAHFGLMSADMQNRTKAGRALKTKGVMTGAKDKRFQRKYITDESVTLAIKTCSQLRKTYGKECAIQDASGPMTDVDILVKSINTPAGPLDNNIRRF